MKRYILLTIIAALAAAVPARAQRFSIGTNGLDWLALGTINAEAGVAVAQHWSVHAGAEVNPWTFAKNNEEKQFQNRHITYWAGVKYWPWYCYSGWWWGGDLRYDVYNQGGIFTRKTEEGDAYGLGAYGGYSIMINSWLNLDLGFGIYSGWKRYTQYACPRCGVILDQGGKVFFHPDARVALQLVF